MKIVTVCRSGGVYTPDHVNSLYQQVKQQNGDYKFLCITDYPSDLFDPKVQLEPVRYGWERWYSKLEIFMQMPPCLYLDLSVLLIGDNILADLLEAAEGKAFVAVRDIYRGRQYEEAVQSTVMYWERNLSYITRLYRRFPVLIYGAALGRGMDMGDQLFIELTCREEPTFWQDITDKVYSFREDVLPNFRHPPTEGLVLFHGRPKIWEQKLLLLPKTTG